MKHNVKRIALVLVLALCLAVSLMPAMVFATGDYDYIVYRPCATMEHKLTAPVEGVTTKVDEITAGVETTLEITMKNAGDCTMTYCEVQLGNLPSGVSVFNGTDRKQLGTLQRAYTYSSNDKSKATTSFTILAADTVKTGIYTFPVTLSGYDPYNTRYSVTETLYLSVIGRDDVPVEEPADAPKTPILMVSSYSQNGTAWAGKTFGLNLTVLNTSTVTLRNIKVTVGSGGGVFVPSGSSNAYYIDSIEAGKTASKTLNFTVSSQAAQTTTPIDINMTYEDMKGVSYSAADTIAIPVKQETRLVIDNLSDMSWAYANEPMSAQIQFYNMGKNTIDNVKVTVSGDFDVTKNPSYFVGNMSSGQSSTYKFTIMPLDGGTKNGVITFTYDDAAGNQVSEEVPFTFEAQSWEEPVWDDPGFEDPGMMDPMPETKPIPWKWIGLGGGVVLIAAIIIISKAKKKKAAKALELEDLND